MRKAKEGKKEIAGAGKDSVSLWNELNIPAWMGRRLGPKIPLLSSPRWGTATSNKGTALLPSMFGHVCSHEKDCSDCFHCMWPPEWENLSSQEMFRVWNKNSVQSELVRAKASLKRRLGSQGLYAQQGQPSQIARNIWHGSKDRHSSHKQMNIISLLLSYRVNLQCLQTNFILRILPILFTCGKMFTLPVYVHTISSSICTLLLVQLFETLQLLIY